MGIPERVIWSEGMLLAPQHFQQQDRYHEALLDMRLGSVTAFGWGVAEIELDLNALAAETVSFRKFVGVLPGGLPVAFSEGQRGAPATRSVAEHFGPAKRLLRVFLGVPREREGAVNVSTDDAGARFVQLPRDVFDLTSDREATAPVGFARANTQILFEDEANNDFDFVKVAEIVRNSRGELVSSGEYIPPSIQIGASPIILESLRDLLGVLVAKRTSLCDIASQFSRTAMEFRAADITSFLQLSAVNAAIPVVQHMVDTPSLSTWQAYVLLSQIAGQLLTFSVEQDPTAFPKFVYQDLGMTFGALFREIKVALGTAFARKSAAIPMKLFKNGILVASLNDEHVKTGKTFVVAAKAKDSSLPPEKLALNIPKLAKIGSKSEIKNIVQAARNGIPLSNTHRPPPEIPVREGVVYFLMDITHPGWQAVRNERSLALFMPSPYGPKDVKFELMGLLESD